MPDLTYKSISLRVTILGDMPFFKFKDSRNIKGGRVTHHKSTLLLSVIRILSLSNGSKNMENPRIQGGKRCHKN